MILDGLDYFKFFKIFCFPNKLFFSASILRAIHSIDISMVKIIISEIYMHAALTNQITDFWDFNNKEEYQEI